MGFFAAGKMGQMAFGRFEFAADDSDGVGSFDAKSDAVAGDPVDDDRDVSADDETFTDFTTENQHDSSSLPWGAPVLHGQGFHFRRTRIFLIAPRRMSVLPIRQTHVEEQALQVVFPSP